MEEKKMTPEEEKRMQEVLKAFKVATQNSYMRMLFGDSQLFYMFMAGMRFQETGKSQRSLLDNPEFLSDPENFIK